MIVPHCRRCDSAALSDQLMCRHQIASKLLAESNFIFNCNHLYVKNFKSSSIAVLVARLQFGGKVIAVKMCSGWPTGPCMPVLQ